MTGLKALVGPEAADYAAVKSTYQVNGEEVTEPSNSKPNPETQCQTYPKIFFSNYPKPIKLYISMSPYI